MGPPRRGAGTVQQLRARAARGGRPTVDQGKTSPTRPVKKRRDRPVGRALVDDLDALLDAGQPVAPGADQVEVGAAARARSGRTGDPGGTMFPERLDGAPRARGGTKDSVSCARERDRARFTQQGSNQVASTNRARHMRGTRSRRARGRALANQAGTVIETIWSSWTQRRRRSRPRGRKENTVASSMPST